MEKRTLNTIIIGISLIISTLIISLSFRYDEKKDKKNERYGRINNRHSTINVFGIGKKEIPADMIIIRSSFTIENGDLEKALSKLKSEKKTLKNYLLDKGIDNSEIIFPKATFGTDSINRYNGVLYQNVILQSEKVNITEEILKKGLKAHGINFSKIVPEYLFRNLGEIRVELYGLASKDGYNKVKSITDNANSSLGNLSNTEMEDVFIIEKNGNKKLPESGNYYSSSKRKTFITSLKMSFDL